VCLTRIWVRRRFVGWVVRWCGSIRRGVGGEFSVGSEGDVPVVVVDVGVVDTADGQEVVQVGAALVAPPDDVVEFAAVVGDAAAGDGAVLVQATQRAALRAVGEAGGAAEVEFAGCVQHDAVAHDDGVGVGVAGEGGEDAGGDLDADGELGDRSGVAGGVGVDDGDELGLGGSWPRRSGRSG
jgi:hypothetical protein